MRQLFFLYFFLLSSLSSAQDTFSILAVDTATGEVGSAGATCLDLERDGAGAIIISEVFPGKGAIHTQSYWNPVNQRNARRELLNGRSPQELMLWLRNNDAQRNSSVRQYGAVDFAPDGGARAGAFTGINCLDYKGQIVGDHYAIQGNILLGPEVLSHMEESFLNTQGTLAERLMAALQGANIPGADVRCLSEGRSSRSAFLRVARPEDNPGDLYLDLRVDVAPNRREPIDLLQEQFDEWLITGRNGPPEKRIRLFPNPANSEIVIELIGDYPEQPFLQLDIISLSGRHMARHAIGTKRTVIPGRQFHSGVYICRITNKNGKHLFSQKLIVP